MTSSPIRDLCEPSFATTAIPAASNDSERTSLVPGTKSIVKSSTAGQTVSLNNLQPQFSTTEDIRKNQSFDPKLLRRLSETLDSERSEATRTSDDDSAACKAGESSADRYSEVDVERPITEGLRQYVQRSQCSQRLIGEIDDCTQSNTCSVVKSTLSMDTFTNCQHNSRATSAGSLSLENGFIELRASFVPKGPRNNSTRMLKIDPKIPRQWANNKKALTTPYKLVIDISEKETDGNLGIKIFNATHEFIIKDSNHQYALLSREEWQAHNHILETYISIKLMKYQELVVTDPTDEDEDGFVEIAKADP